MSRDANVGGLVKDFVLTLVPLPPHSDRITYLALGDSISFFVHGLVLTDTPPNRVEAQLDLLGISPVDPIV